MLAGGLAIGAWWLYRKRDLLTAPAALRGGEGEAIFNAWLKIARDGQIIVQVPRQEMGQGVVTALPMLVAEELDADFADVRFEQAPIDEIYGNATMFGDGVPFRPDDTGWLAELSRLTQFKIGRALGLQATGGSTSVRDAWEPMRKAGAAARLVLLDAAAQKFGVSAADCEVSQGIITQRGTSASATFAELTAAAASLPLPRDIPLKTSDQFTIIGTAQARIDIPEKIDGRAMFGLDARPRGMVYAALAQSPVSGGTLAKLNGHAAREMPGVRAIVELAATSMSEAAVAVVADHYWQAKKALEATQIDWAPGANGAHDTAIQKQRYAARLQTDEGRTYDHTGDVEQRFAAAARTIDVEYHAPYLAHATMEPINCTTVVRSDRTAEVWVGNQAPSVARWVTAKAADLDTERVVVHTPYLGGGFGRRGEMDAVMQAVLIAKQLPDTPVQLVWSREEDIQHDLYRPMGAARMRGAIDGAGKLSAYDAKLVGQSCMYSITARLMPGMESNLMKDRTAAEGVFDLPYDVDARRVRQILTDEPVKVGFWRSVGHSHHAFFAECFIDECAHAADVDALEFRRALLKHAPRHQNVLNVVAEKAGWGSQLPPNVGRGVALAESFGSIVAEVAEVELVNGEVRVRRVVCAIDCGIAVNPDTVVAQMESGIIFGLSATLYGEITIKNGRVQQSNFPDYRMIDLAQSPHIEVEIVESGIDQLGGVGEPGTPPIAPAVCNALFALTGKRVRELPIRVT